MSKYEVEIYKGGYKARQREANAEECVAYVEHHFNGSERSSANYTVVITGSNASAKSRSWGRWYARAIGREFGTRVAGDGGIKVGGYEGRGDYNIRYTDMPAILLEPLFGSNPQHAQWIKSQSGQERLARVLCESIRHMFPGGGKIAFSVGHKYKTSRPHDRGAPIYGGGTEADYAEKVLEIAAQMLEQDDEPPAVNNFPELVRSAINDIEALTRKLQAAANGLGEIITQGG